MDAPCLAAGCKQVTWQLFGHWHLGGFTVSPALLILPFPLLFRLTCYYYRKAYYRGFWLSPPAGAVAETHRSYTGEPRCPLIAQTLHPCAFTPRLPSPIFLLWAPIAPPDCPSGSAVCLAP